MDLFEFQASQLARALNDTMAAPAAAEPGYLFGTDLHMTSAAVAINDGTTQTQLEDAESAFTGYAPKPITWGAPSISDDGIVEVLSDQIEFRPTDGAAPENAFDVWVADGGSGVPYFAGEFDNPPLPMNSADDVILITLRYRPAEDSMAVVIS